MRIVFAGTPSAAVDSLKVLAKSKHEIVAVLTRPDAASGRGKKITESPVALTAAELGLPVMKPQKIDDDFVAVLEELKPDICVVVAYGSLIPAKALAIPNHGWINLHFSLLPKWRGAAPVQRAIMAGDQITGLTTFKLVEALDEGPIYRQRVYKLGPLETAGRVLEQLANFGAKLILTTLDDIEAGVEPTPQDEQITPSYAHKLTSEELRINWHKPASKICDLILGASPDPGAWCEFMGNRFKVLLAGEDEAPVNLAPGQLFADRKHLWVGAGGGEIELLKVQAFGKRPMSGADWARGIPVDDLEANSLV